MGNKDLEYRYENGLLKKEYFSKEYSMVSNYLSNGGFRNTPKMEIHINDINVVGRTYLNNPNNEVAKEQAFSLINIMLFRLSKKRVFSTSAIEDAWDVAQEITLNMINNNKLLECDDKHEVFEYVANVVAMDKEVQKIDNVLSGRLIDSTFIYQCKKAVNNLRLNNIDLTIRNIAIEYRSPRVAGKRLATMRKKNNTEKYKNLSLIDIEEIIADEREETAEFNQTIERIKTKFFPNMNINKNVSLDEEEVMKKLELSGVMAINDEAFESDEYDDNRQLCDKYPGFEAVIHQYIYVMSKELKIIDMEIEADLEKKVLEACAYFMFTTATGKIIDNKDRQVRISKRLNYLKENGVIQNDTIEEMADLTLVLGSSTTQMLNSIIFVLKIGYDTEYLFAHEEYEPIIDIYEALLNYQDESNPLYKIAHNSKLIKKDSAKIIEFLELRDPVYAEYMFMRKNALFF